MVTLAGYPFFISPKELYNMDIDDLRYWDKLASKRIKIDNKAKQGK